MGQQGPPGKDGEPGQRGEAQPAQRGATGRPSPSPLSTKHFPLTKSVMQEHPAAMEARDPWACPGHLAPEALPVTAAPTGLLVTLDRQGLRDLQERPSVTTRRRWPPSWGSRRARWACLISAAEPGPRPGLSDSITLLVLLQGPDPLMGGDEPPRIFGKELTEAERRELLLKAYNHVKESLERFRRPDGKKDAPARTCRDLHVAHPDLPSGKAERIGPGPRPGQGRRKSRHLC